MTSTRHLLRRVVTLRLVTIPALALTAVLAVFAVLVAIQSGPTKTAAQARAELQEVVATVTGVEPIAAPDAPCGWFGVGGKVSPQLRVPGFATVPDAQRTLDVLATRLIAAGWEVGRLVGGLDAAGPDGRHLAAQSAAGGLDVMAEGPCVWPDGERKPLP